MNHGMTRGILRDENSVILANREHAIWRILRDCRGLSKRYFFQNRNGKTLNVSKSLQETKRESPRKKLSIFKSTSGPLGMKQITYSLSLKDFLKHFELPTTFL